MDKQDTITIKAGRSSRTIKIPRTWDDLDDRTALLFYNTLFSGLGNDLTAQAFTAVKLISIAQHMLGLTPELMAAWEDSYLKKDATYGADIFLEELKQVITTALGGLFDIRQDEETGATTYAVKFSRTRNPWPALTHTPKIKKGQKRPKTTWLYGPANGLANITIYELAYTFAQYEAYAATGDERYANTLIGVLYRPSRPETKDERDSAWHGDRRQPLRNYEGKVEERANLAATMPALTRRFMVFWFASCREAIAEQYPRVFKKGGKGEGGGSDWGKLLLSLAETGTFGSLSETSDQHYSNALAYMSMKDEQVEETRREMDKMKRKK